MNKNGRGWGVGLLLGAGVLLVGVLGLLLGPVPLTFAELSELLLRPDAADAVVRAIVWDYRLPRVLTAALAGLSLALAGAAMQTLLANPLAGPDVLGVSAGASLGVAVSLLAQPLWGGTPLSTLAAQLGPTVLAVVGAGAVLSLQLLAARWLSTTTLLLLGLMVATAASGVISLLQFVAGAEQGRAFLIWSFGSVAGSTWGQLPALAASVGLGVVLVLAQHRGLDLLRLGPLTAQSMGVDVGRLRLGVLLGTSLLTGAVTAVCGPIAFIGVAVPHLARGLDPRPSHRTGLLSAALTGALVLMGCDLLSQLMPGGRVLPLNALTAVVGAPVVAWVIVRAYPRGA